MTILLSLVAQLLHIGLMIAAAPTMAGLTDWLDARLTGRAGPPVLLPWRDLIRLSRKTPIGSGPYRFVEWVPNDRVTLQRNPRYWNEAGAGHVDRIVLKPVTELQTRISQLLAGDGAMLLQAITIDDRGYDVQKASRSFINTHIFPGGCLPSTEVIAHSVARRTDMQLAHLEDLTPHYVETLRHWRTNFTAHADELEALGYDDRFQRLWQLYLAYCEAGFAERRICLVQTLLTKPLWRSSLNRASEQQPRDLVRVVPHGDVSAAG